MRHLIVGGHGLLGTALRRLCEEACGLDYAYTERRPVGADSRRIFYDLASGNPHELPPADVVYLVAAVTSTIRCEDDPRGTWQVNVDAPLALARRYAPDGFIVFISSDAVEFCGRMEYGRQKAHVEAALALHERCSVVRPARFTADNVDRLARFIVSPQVMHAGLHRWAP